MTETELKEAELNISTAGQKRIGEGTAQGMQRTKEIIHQAATNISTGQVNSYITCGIIIDCLYF